MAKAKIINAEKVLGEKITDFEIPVDNWFLLERKPRFINFLKRYPPIIYNKLAIDDVTPSIFGGRDNIYIVVKNYFGNFIILGELKCSGKQYSITTFFFNKDYVLNNNNWNVIKAYYNDDDKDGDDFDPYIHIVEEDRKEIIGWNQDRLEQNFTAFRDAFAKKRDLQQSKGGKKSKKSRKPVKKQRKTRKYKK